MVGAVCGLTACSQEEPVDPNAVHFSSVSEKDPIISAVYSKVSPESRMQEAPFGRAVVFDGDKVLFSYPGTSGCPSHTEKVTAHENVLEIRFESNEEEDIICTANMTGPFYEIIELPDYLVNNKEIQVKTDRYDIPVSYAS